MTAFVTDPFGVTWETLRSWYDEAGSPPPPPEPTFSSKLENDLPLLEDYQAAQPDSFWERFPFHPMPERAETCINVDAFEKPSMKSSSHDFSPAEESMPGN